jgi:hypothetical protein
MLSRKDVSKAIVGTALAMALQGALVATGFAQDGRPAPDVQPPSASPAERSQPLPGPPPENRSPKPDGDSSTEPESRLQQQLPPSGGCRYRERTLELIV